MGLLVAAFRLRRGREREREKGEKKVHCFLTHSLTLFFFLWFSFPQMDADIVEIPPPIHLVKKQKRRAILHDVIDIDDGDDSEDLVIIGEKVGKSNKGKTVEAIHPVVEASDYIFCQPGVENFEPAILHDVIDIDDGDDFEDLVIIGEKVCKSNKGKTIEAIHPVVEASDYIFCQPGVENFGPAILDDVIAIKDDDDYDDLVILGEKVGKSNKRKTIEAIRQVVEVSDYTFCHPGVEKLGPAYLDSPWYDTQSDAKNSHVTDSSQPSWSLEPNNSRNQGSTMGSSDLQIKMDSVDYSVGIELSSQLFSQASKKKSAPSHRSERGLNLSSGVESSKSKRFLKSFYSKVKFTSFGSKNHGLAGNLEAKKLLNADKPPAVAKFKSAKKAVGNGSSYDPYHRLILQNPSMKQHLDKQIQNYWKSLATHLPVLPRRLVPVMSKGSLRNKMKFAKNHSLAGNPEVRKLLHADKPPATTKFESAMKAYHANFKDEILRKFQSFKQFDTINDPSDHHFFQENSSMQQHPKNWAKVIQKEWKILEKGLPDSIFVRVYESRMDLLRAVIIGAKGTPYHDGLFFFDFYFPSGYPNVPPLVRSHTRSCYLHPYLYYAGGVCLSLLNTSSGSENERWLPGVSTILQVLVSMQGLVLHAKPFFDGLTRSWMRGSANAECMSLLYNENVFMESLRTMIETIRRPPKGFKDFVVGHFVSRAHDILGACNAFLEGGIQVVGVGESCPKQGMKTLLLTYMDRFVSEFANIGAKTEKFLSTTTKANN